MGMSSRGVIDCPHFGQCDRGRTTDSPRGTRQMTTLRNDPISRPNTPQTTAANVVTAHSYRGCLADGAATQPSVENLALVEDVCRVGQHPLGEGVHEQGGGHVVGGGFVAEVRCPARVYLVVGGALVGLLPFTRGVEELA